jgi:hypothetical protein
VLLDREIAPLAPEVEALEKRTDLSATEKAQFVEATTRLKALQHQRELILARTGDEYVVDPPKH